MTSNRTREAFLQYFKEKEHQIVPSAPLLIQNDPSLLFTNAGMNQFKDIFLGSKKAVYKKVADTQKCLRVSGKHNDLEEVGIDTYHHTFFEMLGNWSFGDYFKKEAIFMAWELLTRIYGLNPELLYVTIFEGDKNDHLDMDSEARDCWLEWIQPDKILLGNKKDNFWEMGETGPCGPCSEIHIDLRSASEIAKIPGRELVNTGHPQVVEIWNLVFIQFNRLSGGKLEPLPEKHVDTGMGFERLCMALQKKQSNYDTDIFQPLIQKMALEAGVEYGKNEKTDIALRVIADHIRALVFTISDGQLPSNTGAGYVIRRILRRAVRYGYTYLNFKKPFLSHLLPILSNQFQEIFSNVKEQEVFIQKVIFEEETSFLKTLEQGIGRFEKYESKNKVVDGKFAFELFDTFGFPVDLTLLMAREKGWTVDLEVFDQELEAQRLRARASGSSTMGDWQSPHKHKVHLESRDQEIHSIFIGYDHLECETRVVRFREVTIKGEDYIQWVFQYTPFYPEGGGQVGDQGSLKIGEEILEIVDTKKENNQIIHFTKKRPQKEESLDLPVFLEVDKEGRKSSSRNHTATHLLQSALKQVLGNHIAQKGSLVEPGYLRFDFSHFSKMNEKELEEVERIVNEKIRENILLTEDRNIPYDLAIEKGATALFGEKYGDTVRMITFDPSYSRELCGGTHVSSTGEIGIFEIESESAVGAGIRRIQAKTGISAFDLYKKRRVILKELEHLLKPGTDLVSSVEGLLEELKLLQKQQELIKIQAGKTYKEEFKKILEEKAGLMETFTLSRIISGINPDILKTLVFELLDEFRAKPIALVLGMETDGKPFLSIGFTETLLKNTKETASSIVKKVASIMEGGGGGQPGYATAGGKKLAALEETLLSAEKIIMS